MSAYTDAELELLLTEAESDLAERKESLKGDSPTKAREAVCAFANDLPDHGRPGVLFVGARDNGHPSGLAITDEVLRQLADLKTDGNILPPPTLTVCKRVLAGAEMGIVLVWPADSPPVRYRGRVFIRIGSRRGIATAQDERILNERRRHRDRPFDVQPLPSATVGDLDRVRFESEYLPAAFAPDVLAANQRTYEQRLAATKMILAADAPTPTVLGLLVLGVRTRDFIPGAYVQFLRISGTTLTDPIVDELEIDGTVAHILREVDTKLNSHNRTGVDLTSASTERRTSHYPIVALQQIVRNAVMHRSYESTHAPVRVTWYDDRIEITSPGGPFGAVTAENFGRAGLADYRNPSLAEALRVYGYVQRFGVGIAIAQRALSENGNPPAVFEINASYVGVTMRRAP
ncbi:MAG: putative DNA binding domain-containing protein [Candidatus Riflebacteria bacterium]|nr:putative DNA binding domain-containing protein [Candidatus Riflebacteria bacterium]